jgi:hypothetical protein
MPTTQRTQAPVVVLQTGAAALGHSVLAVQPRHRRDVASQTGVAPVQSAATPGRQPTHMFSCGMVESGT